MFYLQPNYLHYIHQFLLQINPPSLLIRFLKLKTVVVHIEEKSRQINDSYGTFNLFHKRTELDGLCQLGTRT